MASRREFLRRSTAAAAVTAVAPSATIGAVGKSSVSRGALIVPQTFTTEFLQGYITRMNGIYAVIQRHTYDSNGHLLEILYRYRKEKIG